LTDVPKWIIDQLKKNKNKNKSMQTYRLNKAVPLKTGLFHCCAGVVGVPSYGGRNEKNEKTGDN
jgi:hypothetical protein